MIRIRPLAVALLTVTLAAIPAHAQSSQAVASPAAGPRLDGTATAVHHVASTTAQPAPARRENLGQPAALMVVGGAAILVGALVGGDPGTVIMIGGAAALLIGLYQYLE